MVSTIELIIGGVVAAGLFVLMAFGLKGKDGTETNMNSKSSTSSTGARAGDTPADIADGEKNMQAGKFEPNSNAPNHAVVVDTPENQIKTDNKISAVSPTVVCQTDVDLSTAEKCAGFFGFDLSTVDSIAAGKSNDGRGLNAIFVTFKDGRVVQFINPNMAGSTVSYRSTSGAVVTGKPASSSTPQTNVAQPVNVASPPPLAAWATDKNRINLAGTSLNDDCYYHNSGITNKYGTFYTGYGYGSLPLTQLPAGTTIGGMTPVAWQKACGSGSYVVG